MITASIVLFKENLETIKKTVDSFLKTPLEKKLYLIDNSPVNDLESHFKHLEIEYIYVGNNIGFGKAHNLVLNKINSDFHLILNPDVEFQSNVISNLIKVLLNEPKVSFMTPKVLYPNKKCCKQLSLIIKNNIRKNEYQDQDLEHPFYPDFIHGCFMLFKTEDFKRLKGFDERYFLYMEDADMCRKIDDIGKKKLFYPKIEIIKLNYQNNLVEC